MNMRGVRPPHDQRRKEMRTVVDLLSDAEREAAAGELGLPHDATAADVAADLADRPRADALQTLLLAAPDALTMLREIADWLELHGVRARTTGFVLALDRADLGELRLSPQEVELACSWPKRLSKRRQAAFQDVLASWRPVAAAWNALVTTATPRRESMGRAQVRHVRRNQVGPIRREEHVDHGARTDLRHFIERLGRTLALLEPLRSSTVPDVVQLLRQLDGAMRQAEQALAQGPPVRPMRPALLGNVDIRNGPLHRALSRFEEDVRAAATLTEAASEDLLRLDLWRKRPQLYEVWVLVVVLSWLESRGYAVAPQGVTATAAAAPRWELKYANAAKPCATVRGNGVEHHLFYQLFRKPQGGQRADMPDIALLAGADPQSPAVWAIDPKHADRKGYDLADYRDTGKRYASSFGAQRAVIVEYFPRDDIKGGNPLDLDADAVLVKDAGPAGAGVPHLLEQLETFHPDVARVVLCVDASASFDERRDAALDELRTSAALADPGRVEDALVWFAADAEATPGAAAFAGGGDLPGPPAVDRSATELSALIDALRPLVGPARDRVVVVGDGGFGDAAWRETIERTLGVTVEHHP